MRRGLPLGDFTFLGEPKSDFLLGTLDGIRSVADVSTNVDGEVSTDGSWERSQGVGLSEHLSSLLDDVLAFPNHRDNRAGEHVSDEGGEESLGLEVSVVLFEEFSRGLDELESDELVASLFESCDDLTDEVSLDAVRLDHDEGLFGGHLLLILFFLAFNYFFLIFIFLQDSLISGLLKVSCEGELILSCPPCT